MNGHPRLDVDSTLSAAERSQGFVRRLRHTYRHQTCGGITTMGPALAEAFARDPKCFSGAFCVTCRAHCAVAEFTWEKDGKAVGT